MKQQRIIICHKYEIYSEINQLLSDGWAVIPGTTAMQRLNKLVTDYHLCQQHLIIPFLK